MKIHIKRPPQGTSVPPWPRDVATRGDALTLLQSLPDDCAAAAFFDPQHRSVLNRLKYGNEEVRQRARCALAVVVAFGTKGSCSPA